MLCFGANVSGFYLSKNMFKKNMEPMLKGGNRPLVTYELVEFEEWLAQVQDFWENDHLF